MKKEDLKKYKNTKRGYKIYPMLNRIFIDGILCIFCSIFLVVTTIITKDSNWFYLFAVVLLILGIIFIIVSYRFKSEEIYLMKTNEIDKKKKKKSSNIDKK